MIVRNSRMAFIFSVILLFAFFIPAKNAQADVIPALISVSSSSGSTEGGNTVTVIGTNFTESTIIKIGESPVSKTLVSSTEITIVMPPGSVGSVDIGAFSGMSGALLPNAYEYIIVMSEPTPEPTPTPSATPSPTPSIMPTPTPSLAVSSGSSSGSPIVETYRSPATAQSPQTVIVEIPQEIEDNGNVMLISKNTAKVVENDVTSLVITSDIVTQRKFLLMKREGRRWVPVATSYLTNGKVFFINVKLDNDETYKVVTGKPKNRTIVSWFTL